MRVFHGTKEHHGEINVAPRLRRPEGWRFTATNKQLTYFPETFSLVVSKWIWDRRDTLLRRNHVLPPLLQQKQSTRQKQLMRRDKSRMGRCFVLVVGLEDTDDWGVDWLLTSLSLLDVFGGFQQRFNVIHIKNKFAGYQDKARDSRLTERPRTHWVHTVVYWLAKGFIDVRLPLHSAVVSDVRKVARFGDIGAHDFRAIFRDELRRSCTFCNVKWRLSFNLWCFSAHKAMTNFILFFLYLFLYTYKLFF